VRARRLIEDHAFVHYVFAYGSLATGAITGGRRDAGFTAELHGMRRRWGVAMDNRIDLPGYKCYLLDDGRRPALSVCFLDIDDEPAPRALVNGVCLPVAEEGLAVLDRRERNYERIEVSERIGAGHGLRIWAYRGSAAGRARFQAAVHGGTAVIQGAYLRAVRAGFRALGQAAWETCEPSLHPGGIPVVELIRRDLP
jgi:hypothetical protein